MENERKPERHRRKAPTDDAKGKLPISYLGERERGAQPGIKYHPKRMAVQADPQFTSPLHNVNLGNATPHGAKFSPDGGLLVISSLGREVVDQEVQWSGWESPREDKIVVFERAI
jgi:hypothetical protein